jgi:hypothetical protein
MGHFSLHRGLETSGYGHLRNARACYARWGADGKVRQLEQRHPRLAGDVDLLPIGTNGSAVQQLDVTTVVNASQAVSGEITLPKLIETLMRIALENAGADRGLLILRQADVCWIEAEAHARSDRVDVVLQRAPISADNCPEALLRYVIRTQESVILEDACKSNLFSDDDYLKSRQVRSILGLPLLLQGRLAGLLYLENSLTAHAFTSNRIAVLKILASQAAISLENTRLYGDLQERREFGAWSTPISSGSSFGTLAAGSLKPMMPFSTCCNIVAMISFRLACDGWNLLRLNGAGTTSGPWPS